MKCRNPECSYEITAESLYCAKCGVPVLPNCTVCGAEIPAIRGVQCCAHCGTMIRAMGESAKEDLPENTDDVNSPDNITSKKLPKWIPLKAINSKSWAIIAYPALCALNFLITLGFIHSIVLIFSLVGLYGKKNWAFLIAVSIHLFAFVVVIGTGNAVWLDVLMYSLTVFLGGSAYYQTKKYGAEVFKPDISFPF